MSKLSDASVELASTRLRALEPSPSPIGYNVHPPCKRCQRQCDFCLDYMADNQTELKGA